MKFLKTAYKAIKPPLIIFIILSFFAVACQPREEKVRQEVYSYNEELGRYEFIVEEPPVPQNDVWIVRDGLKYHRVSTCSNMKYPVQISKDLAREKGYTPCSKCY